MGLQRWQLASATCASELRQSPGKATPCPQNGRFLFDSITWGGLDTAGQPGGGHIGVVPASQPCSARASLIEVEATAAGELDTRLAVGPGG